MNFDEQASDGIHQVHYDRQARYFERVGHFDYDEVCRNIDGDEPEPEKPVEMSDVAACFSLILEWILGGDSLKLAGARAASLGIYLDPVNNSKFGSNLAEIAREAGCTRAALSKALMDFRDSAGVHLTAGKLGSTRGTYRAAQIKSVESGTHSSIKRKARKAAEEISLATVGE